MSPLFQVPSPDRAVVIRNGLGPGSSHMLRPGNRALLGQAAQ